MWKLKKNRVQLYMRRVSAHEKEQVLQVSFNIPSRINIACVILTLYALVQN